MRRRDKVNPDREMYSEHSVIGSAHDQSTRFTFGADPSQGCFRPLSAPVEATAAPDRLALPSSPGTSPPASWSLSLSRGKRVVADIPQVNNVVEFAGLPQPTYIIRAPCFDGNDAASDSVSGARSAAHCEWGLSKGSPDNTTASVENFDASCGHIKLVPAQRVALRLLRRACREPLRSRYFHTWWRAALLRRLPPPGSESRSSFCESMWRDCGWRCSSRSVSVVGVDNGAVRRSQRLSLRSEEMLRLFYCGALEDEETAARAELVKEEAQVCKRLLGTARRATDEVLMLALRGGESRHAPVLPVHWGHTGAQSGEKSTADREEEEEEEPEKNVEKTEETLTKSPTARVPTADANATGSAVAVPASNRGPFHFTNADIVMPQPSMVHRECTVQSTLTPTRQGSASPGTSPLPDSATRRCSGFDCGISPPLLTPPVAAAKGSSLAGPLAAARGPRPTAEDRSSCEARSPPRGPRPGSAGDWAAREALSLPSPRGAEPGAANELLVPLVPPHAELLERRAGEKLSDREFARRRNILEKYRHGLELIIGACFGVHSNPVSMGVPVDGIVGSRDVRKTQEG